MQHEHVVKIARLMAHMTRDPAGEPIVAERPMSRASTCELIEAIRDEAVTLGMHKAQYAWDDQRIVDQTRKVQMMVGHLRERFECA
jgi:hypothetical protein